MANTFFYREAEQGGDDITWREIFSECRKKHDKKDMEYAMSAGTVMNSATEANMLEKWRKPWLFLRILIGGLVLTAIIYAIFLFNVFFVGYAVEAIRLIVTILPPLVVPVALMVLIWELNIPKNVSIYQLLGMFVIGALLSLTFSMILFEHNGIFSDISEMISKILKKQFGISTNGIFELSVAGFIEEPGKLIAAIIILLFFARKNKIYGLTGLVIGAAVGAGFSGFESAQYASNSYLSALSEYGNYTAASISMLITEIVRMVMAIAGHTIFCAPYIGALALGMQDNKITVKSFLNRDFLITFVISVFCHFFWNMDIPYKFYIHSEHYLEVYCIEEGIKDGIVTVVLWLELLYILKKALRQAVKTGRAAKQGQSRPLALLLVGIAGALKGAVWDFSAGKTLHMGRSEECEFRFPADTKAISRRHCLIFQTQQGWVLRDAGSTYGTYVNGKEKLKPGEERPLREGDTIYLGGKENAFRVVRKT